MTWGALLGLMKKGCTWWAKVCGPRPKSQERMTKDYQQKIRKGPLWTTMVAEYGKEQAEKMLKEFQVVIR